MMCIGTLIAAKDIDEETDDFLASDEWKAQIAGDELLYSAASTSLDMTIEDIGKEKFDARLKEFETLMALADERGCNSDEHQLCSSKGKPVHNCKHGSQQEDCWFVCLDRAYDHYMDGDRADASS